VSASAFAIRTEVVEVMVVASFFSSRPLRLYAQ